MVKEPAFVNLAFTRGQNLNRLITLFSIFVIAFGLSAQTINIKGKVTNQSGKAISGAIVTLKSQKLADTTDSFGAFSISGGTSAVITASPSQSGNESVSMKNGTIEMHLSKGAAVRLELFDLQGNLLEKSVANASDAGNYRFDLSGRGIAAKTMMVRVAVGQNTFTFRSLPFGNKSQTFTSTASSSKSEVFAKMLATVDSLQVMASKYASKTVKITSYDTTVDISLDTAVCKANPSKQENQTVTGTGPHKVVIETNSDQGIKSGTINRPADLGAGKNYPIFVWGEGGCEQNGYYYKETMGEFASRGYFVIADGSSAGGGGTAAAMLAYITWAIAENRNPCSAYYQSLDTSKIAADGFSCGGLMAENAASDPRFTAIGMSSSGQRPPIDQNVYKKIHTPFKIMNGGSSDIAYENGLNDYNAISALGKPIIYFSKTSAGHGGDLDNPKGDFNTINLAWLNWQLKGDTGATGKELLIGANCKFCKSGGWVFKSANIN
jgi:hypothetical protein